MSTLTEPHTNGHDRELGGGVRTYRGRKLEDLIPQIREELGPDAIILRQREGLMGGVGGFFAQKCVEVDAQAAPRVDIYDDDQPVSGWELPDEDFSLTEFPALPAAEEPPAPEAFVPPAHEAPAAPAPEAPAPSAPAPEGAAESFVSRLEQAAAHVDIDELVKLVTTGGLPATDQVDGAPEPVIPEPPAPDRSRAGHASRASRARSRSRARRSPEPRRRGPRSPRESAPTLRPPRPFPAPAPAPVAEVPRPGSRPGRAGRSPRSSGGTRRRRPGAGPGPAGREPLGRQAGRRHRLGRRDGRRPGADLTGHQRRVGHRTDRRRGRAPLAALRRQPA